MKQIAVAILTLKPGSSYAVSRRIPATVNRAGVIFLLLFLFIAEVARVYFVMPFPGSQTSDTVGIAYWFTRNIGWVRLLSAFVFITAFARVLRYGRSWEKISLAAALILYIPVYLLFNYRFDADHIFRQPTQTLFIPAAETIDKTKLVVGVVINGEAKAYPIQLIGYHHQVTDKFGNEPVMVTYCTVCRTGRVYSTMIDGREEKFRLVGMDHFNAVFEDETTKSWWQQANGEAIAGPRKGSRLKEIPSVQMTVDTWIRQHPKSLVMASDPLYDERYFKLEDYDRGTMQSALVRRDQRAWQPKSWVVGVKNEFSSMAYDWNDLVNKRVIQDSLRALPIILAMETDTTSFHVYDRRVNGTVLQFSASLTNDCLTDTGTNSVWNMDGLCIGGPLKGQQLTPVQAYNEFWHSWERFQPNPGKFVAGK